MFLAGSVTPGAAGTGLVLVWSLDPRRCCRAGTPGRHPTGSLRWAPGVADTHCCAGAENTRDHFGVAGVTLMLLHPAGWPRFVASVVVALNSVSACWLPGWCSASSHWYRGVISGLILPSFSAVLCGALIAAVLASCRRHGAAGSCWLPGVVVTPGSSLLVAASRPGLSRCSSPL